MTQIWIRAVVRKGRKGGREGDGSDGHFLRHIFFAVRLLSLISPLFGERPP